MPRRGGNPRKATCPKVAPKAKAQERTPRDEVEEEATAIVEEKKDIKAIKVEDKSQVQGQSIIRVVIKKTKAEMLAENDAMEETRRERERKVPEYWKAREAKLAAGAAKAEGQKQEEGQEVETKADEVSSEKEEGPGGRTILLGCKRHTRQPA